MLIRVVSGIVLALLLLNMFSVVAEFPNEPHEADAMWIEPSTVSLSASYRVGIGHRFDVTVYVNLTFTCWAWTFGMLYDKAKLNATGCGYTAGMKSQFFENITTIPLAPIFQSYNETHNRVVFAESWSDGPMRDPWPRKPCLG